MGRLERLVKLCNKQIQKLSKQIRKKQHQKDTIAVTKQSKRRAARRQHPLQLCLSIYSMRQDGDQRSRQHTLGQKLYKHLSTKIKLVSLLQEEGEDQPFFGFVLGGQQRRLREDEEGSHQPAHPLVSA